MWLGFNENEGVSYDLILTVGLEMDGSRRLRLAAMRTTCGGGCLAVRVMMKLTG
jgi:hypothetical protein